MTQPKEQLIETNKINVTISRLPESVISELETELGLFYDENDLDPDHVHTLQALIVGYDAAWDEIERLLEENKRQRYENEQARLRRKEELYGKDVTIETLRSQLQQTREELEYHKEALAGAENMMHQRLQELEQVKAELAAKDKVLEFAKEVLRVAFAGGSLDGGDIQEMGVKYGLLEQTAYDPEKHEENWDFEPGDPYFCFTPILSQYKGEVTG